MNSKFFPALIILLSALMLGTASCGDDALILESTTLPNAQVDIAYTALLQATGGNENYRWRMVDGQLPDGISLDRDGLLSGTSTTAGSFEFMLQVLDTSGRRDSRDFTLLVL